MTDEEFKALQSGDIVRNKSGSESIVVTANYGTRVTAVRTYDLSNPAEWDLIKKSSPSLAARVEQRPDASETETEKRGSP